MKTILTAKSLRAELSALRKTDTPIVFVPTMGNIHQGHVELVLKGRSLGPNYKVVVSIFVNPLQFGPTAAGGAGNDYNQYPRTLEEDQEKLGAAGCNFLFAPESAYEIYAEYPTPTQVSVGEIGRILEGEYRPCFLEGMATVVLILYNLVQPNAMIFGEKDWQQLQVVRNMARDFRLEVEVIGVPTVRDQSGLALSSRNTYLSPEEKLKASGIYRTLKEIEKNLLGGNRNYSEMEGIGKDVLMVAGFNTQYLAIRSHNLSLPTVRSTEFVILVAAFLGTTRLIDNLTVEIL